jgi:signal transduction histidine kinase
MNAEDIQKVRRMPLFAGLADEQLDLIAAGEIIELPVGSVLGREGEKSEYFYLNLEGEVRVWRSYDHEEVLMGVSKPGVFMGEMSFLLDAPWMATACVSKPARLFRLSRDGFWKLFSACPSVAQQIFREAAGRFRKAEGFDRQREKLISLATMAAGLAHELNNPASAALRAASYFRQTADNVQSFLCELVYQLDRSVWDHLLEMELQAMERLGAARPIDAIARSDAEEALGAWFEKRQIPEGRKLAFTFVEAGVDSSWLETFIVNLPSQSRGAGLRWLEARLNLRLLLQQVEGSIRRVSELVKAVKSYTCMGQSAFLEIDIHEGIESTLTILDHKLKGVTLVRAFDRSIPRIMAHGGELNQVWTNLIDNAIDAVHGAGRICIGTCCEDNQVVVEIVDNGSGIPLDVQSHLFEPFFTTKAVGSGTGLGLIISNRIVAGRHGGEIEFESKPGETRFKIKLPIDRKKSHGNPAASPADGM